MRVAVFNQKGGVGKTTTALNLAAGLALGFHPVRLIDLDPQAHLSAIRGAPPADWRQSIYAHFPESTPLHELEVDWEGLGRFIPSHSELMKVDSAFGKGPEVLERLNRGMRDLDRSAPRRLTIIDCCPYLGVLALNAIFAADGLIVPVSSDYLSMRGAEQIERTLKALEPVLRRRVERRYLLTRFDRRRRMSFEVESRMREKFRPRCLRDDNLGERGSGRKPCSEPAHLRPRRVQPRRRGLRQADRRTVVAALSSGIDLVSRTGAEARRMGKH